MENHLRYALYFAPRSGAFRSTAESWLGRDALTGQPLTQPDLGLDAEAITREPRRYGLHATLKPPFRLAEGRSLDRLIAEISDFAAEAAPIPLEGLMLRRIGNFVALVPQRESRALGVFAARVVQRFDRFRAPLNEAEIARRKPERLTPRQRALLELCGYPYVMEEFRFHMTLTDSLDPETAAHAETALQAHFAPHLSQPIEIEDLCLFGQTADGSFRELHRIPLKG